MNNELNANKEETALHNLRKFRGFDTIDVCESKTKAINQFFSTEHLDTAVIGLSGGVDSAVALALLIAASERDNSPIKKIFGLAMPIYGFGATGQSEATERAASLRWAYQNCQKFEFRIADLTRAYNDYYDVSSEETISNWAAGQLLSIVRTPFLYFQAALLQTQQYKSIVVGTTNRDEGSYLGFYGKASDAMVDLQPIADLHKSEVYKLAHFLSVPSCIIQSGPKGDVHDGKTDEQMIGATYDQVELYILLKDYIDKQLTVDLDESTLQAFCNIETLHRHNAHKYKVGLPSRFVDVLNRTVVGGWQ